MDSVKRKFSNEAPPFKRSTKNKKRKSDSMMRDNDDAPLFKKKKSQKGAKSDKSDAKKEDENEVFKAELLDAQTIKEGMLLLGCVTNVKATYFVMSLPGCLSGIVHANNISNTLTKAITTSDNEDLEVPALDSLIEVGMVFPCKVIQISHDISKKRPNITLSINPEDVNGDLKPSSLYPKMVLYVSVCSKEDHGYIVNVGSKHIHGFLLKYNSTDENVLQIGEVIPTFVQKITFNTKTSVNVQLSRLNFNEEYPEVSALDIKLHSILPGAKVRADVIEIKQHFAYMKYLDFNACMSLLFCGSVNKAVKVGCSVLGTVLYIHPITHMIYLMLSPKPTPETFSKICRLRKFDMVGNPTFQHFYKNRAYYKVTKRKYGFINIRDLPRKESSISNSSASTLGIIPKACVLSFHYMDNLLQMTAKPALTEKKIILPQEVEIGDIYDATVKKHVEDGMIVSICPGLTGFVRQLHMSDVYVTKPQKLFPVESKVKCRVLSTNGKGRVNLTCKNSLVNLEDCYVLSSYHTVIKGQFYKGVIVKITDLYILVLFFNDVQGVVHSSHIPATSVFFVGQIVLCEVLACDASKQKLQLSLKTENWCSLEEMADDCDQQNTSKKSVNKSQSSKTCVKGAKELMLHASKIDDEDDDDDDILVDQVLTAKDELDEEYDINKRIKAVIKKAKGSQLNIVVGNKRGRIHITELGCVSEGIFPLRKFSPEQKILVHIIGEYVKRRRNYLEVTHRNTVMWKECALKLPAVPLSRNYKHEESLIGFVKEVYDIYALLWLSPNEIGILDALHFSKNVKVVRKFQKHLKTGLSLKVSVLNNEDYPRKGKDRHYIPLTKIDFYIPEVGKNILGLVQIACLQRGLILKLPFGYHGAVCITDLTDVYVPVLALLEKYRKLKYIQCHVLEVNHETKYCALSLRKSRLYEKKASAAEFCPEITVDSIKQGDAVKGYVRYVSDSAITIVFGRELQGKAHMHSCALTDCGSCKIAKNILNKYPIGSVIEVFIDQIPVDKKSFILTPSEIKENTKYDRLCIREDITWDEMQ